MIVREVLPFIDEYYDYYGIYSFNPNKYISLNTVKSEINYRIQYNEEGKWNEYKNTRKDKTNWSHHYFKWNISYSKNFGKELVHFTKLQNNLRIMIYTNHLPLNKFINEFLKKDSISPYCDNNDCKILKKDESLYHFYVNCPRYNEHRNILLNEIKSLYKKHNSNNEKKIYFINNKNNDIYLRQFIFSNFKFEDEIRINIIKSTIYYIINTKRFKNGFYDHINQ